MDFPTWLPEQVRQAYERITGDSRPMPNTLLGRLVTAGKMERGWRKLARKELTIEETESFLLTVLRASRGRGYWERHTITEQRKAVNTVKQTATKLARLIEDTPLDASTWFFAGDRGDLLPNREMGLTKEAGGTWSMSGGLSASISVKRKPPSVFPTMSQILSHLASEAEALIEREKLVPYPNVENADRIYVIRYLSRYIEPRVSNSDLATIAAVILRDDQIDEYVVREVLKAKS